MNDQFSKWMLGISAAVIVAMGGALFSTVVALREDMAVIKSELKTVAVDVAKLERVQAQLADHEYRIQWIERDGNHTAAASTSRSVDTLRRPIR